jgi:Domain of unknown function (DUF4272)
MGVISFPLEAREVPRDARDRQVRSEEELGQFGVRTPSTLPPVASETEVVLRAPSEVARRALALFVVALRAESLMSPELAVAELREKRPLAFRSLTPKECLFVNDEKPDQEQITNFVWRYEALWILAWALGLVEVLCYPSETCDLDFLSKTFLATDEEALVKKSKLLPTETLLDALDLHFRLHWVIRQRQQDGKPPDGERGGSDLNPGVVLERHHALNWLVQHEGAEWDDVQTPT